MKAIHACMSAMALCRGATLDGLGAILALVCNAGAVVGRWRNGMAQPVRKAGR